MRNKLSSDQWTCFRIIAFIPSFILTLTSEFVVWSDSSSDRLVPRRSNGRQLIRMEYNSKKHRNTDMEAGGAPSTSRIEPRASNPPLMRLPSGLSAAEAMKRFLARPPPALEKILSLPPTFLPSKQGDPSDHMNRNGEASSTDLAGHKTADQSHHPGEERAVGATRASGLSSFTSQSLRALPSAPNEDDSIRASSSPTISVHRSLTTGREGATAVEIPPPVPLSLSLPLPAPVPQPPCDTLFPGGPDTLFPGGPDIQFVSKELKKCGFKVEESLALLRPAFEPDSLKLKDAMRSYRLNFEGTLRPKCDEFLVGILGLDKYQELRAPPSKKSIANRKRKLVEQERKLAEQGKRDGQQQTATDNFALLALLMEQGIVQPDVAAAILPHLSSSDPTESQHQHQHQHQRRQTKRDSRLVSDATAAAEALLQSCTDAPYDAQASALMGDHVGGGEGGMGVQGEGWGGMESLDVPKVLGIILRLCESEEGVEELMSGAHNSSLGLTEDFEWTKDSVDYLRTTAECVAPFSNVS